MKDHEKDCLPLDLVGDILSRLPVKSLIRFRSVCKPWRFLINDANFAKEQHIRASPALIYPYDIRDGGITFYHFDRPECNIKEQMPKLEFKELVACHLLSNSVNGLICGYNYTSDYEMEYCLLNPSTRTLVRVPGPNLNQGGFAVRLGLGFDVLTGNYKLVLLYHADVCSCFVLTVGCDDKWRYVGDAPSLFPSWQPVFVEGVISWLSHLRLNGENVILAFRVKDEKFHVISTPKSELSTYGMHLSSGDEHLWLSEMSKECLSIWKLNDHTSQKWTREYQIHFPHGTVCFFPGPDAIKDDKFVFSCTEFCVDSQLASQLANVMVFFDNVRKSLKYYVSKLPPVALYTESLVCPRNLLGLE